MYCGTGGRMLYSWQTNKFEGLTQSMQEKSKLSATFTRTRIINRITGKKLLKLKDMTKEKLLIPRYMCTGTPGKPLWR